MLDKGSGLLGRGIWQIGWKLMGVSLWVQRLSWWVTTRSVFLKDYDYWYRNGCREDRESLLRQKWT